MNRLTDIAINAKVCKRRIPILLLVLGAFIGACGTNAGEEAYLARVGNRYFTVDELATALRAGPVLQDSVDAAARILEQWVTTELLYNEAVRRGLKSDHIVLQQLEENERSILTGALLELMYDEQGEDVTTQELEKYYTLHRDRLAISEPFVRVRYLSSPIPDSALAISAAMQNVHGAANPDSAWSHYLNVFSRESNVVIKLSDSYYPLAQLTRSIPGLETALEAAAPGEVITPFKSQGTFHVVQLVDRLEVGAIPELEMIRDFVHARVVIESRKQMIARQVQRLRNNATARDELEIRE